jgi:hypothetical protein
MGDGAMKIVADTLLSALTDKTPMWTLIGVVAGFALNWFFSYISRRREYREKVVQSIERIKGGMHMAGSQLGPQRISDLLPQFGEQERIQILGEVGSESSMNADIDQVTHYILDEFSWYCTLYELFPQHPTVKRSKHDIRRVSSILLWLEEIGTNVVEFRQSEALLRKVFNLGNTLHTYAITQGYPDIVSRQIRIYGHTGKLSVGIMYGVTGYKVLNFRCGIEESQRQIRNVREQVQRSAFTPDVRDRLLGECDAAVSIIQKEQAERDV